MEQKPSIGRVIVYDNPAVRTEHIRQHSPPALIVKVNEYGTVLAHVFTDKGSFNSQARRWACEWNWPKRI